MAADGFDPAEKHQSQIPALQLLVALGYQPLSQADAIVQRGGWLRNVVLDDLPAEQLLKNLRLAEPDAVGAIAMEHFDGLVTFDDLGRDGRCVADMWF